jgi:Uma2 family endonuclease
VKHPAIRNKRWSKEIGMVASSQRSDRQEIPGPVTYQDWLQMPESKQLLELWNGEVVVPPGPETVHMDAQNELFVQLWHAARHIRDAGVYTAPYEVRLREQTVVQPDIVVFTTQSPGRKTRRGFEGVPDLMVEILSPSNRGHDLIRKSALYAEAGVPEYWVVDPVARHLIIGRLRDGYYEREIVTGGSIECLVLEAQINVDFLAELKIDPQEP